MRFENIIMSSKNATIPYYNCSGAWNGNYLSLLLADLMDKL